MVEQKKIFLEGEADAWFERNQAVIDTRDVEKDIVVRYLISRGYKPKNFLEIGCSNGWRLRGVERLMGAACFGIELSVAAVEDAKKQSPHLDVRVGAAHALPYDDHQFDMVLYGGCFSYCEPEDYFTIIKEGDRVLADGGTMIIYDFCTNTAYRNAYHHQPGLFCHKMPYADLFTCHPAYQVVHHEVIPDDTGMPPADMDQRYGMTVLRKDMAAGFANGAPNK